MIPSQLTLRHYEQATGYKHDFPFLDASYPRAADASIRDILAPDEPTVAFIGFTRPGEFPLLLQSTPHVLNLSKMAQESVQFPLNLSFPRSCGR